MKALFIGGVKSGKSALAEEYTLKHSQEKPYYLATTEFIDSEMQKRIIAHKKYREDNFITLEEPIHLVDTIKNIDGVVLVECLSMWINNMLYHKKSFDDMLKELEALLTLKNSIVFVLSDVGSCVVPQNKLAREFIDISGKIAQLVARECDDVFHVIAGIGSKIK